MKSPPVAVGVDGSESSDAAARWAADEAFRRNLPLRVVHAVPPVTPGAFPTALAWSAMDWQTRAERLLDDATAPLRELYPGLAIEGHAYIGQPPARALSDEAESAEMLVLSSRGRGGFASLLLGSTAVQVLELAGSPVVIVRRPPAGRDLPVDGPVVVGVDGSDPSRRALPFAFAEAALRETALTAVHAWALREHPGIASMRASGLIDTSFLERQAAEMLEEALAGVRADFPDVEVTERLVDDQPVRALVEASRSAQLLVLGSRGRSALSGLVLGSVSHSAVRGADCPVAVIR